MSRGLGVRQHTFLHALRRLEESADGWRGPWFPVWLVACEVWNAELEEKRAALFVKRAANLAASEKAEAEWWDEVRRRADAGDKDAVEALQREKYRQTLGDLIRSWTSHKKYGGAPPLRPNRELEAMLTPSRLFAALARRGLVKHGRAYGNAVRLTDAGRAICNGTSAELRGPVLKMNMETQERQVYK